MLIAFELTNQNKWWAMFTFVYKNNKTYTFSQQQANVMLALEAFLGKFMNKKACWKFRPDSKQLLSESMYVLISPHWSFSRANEISHFQKTQKVKNPNW